MLCLSCHLPLRGAAPPRCLHCHQLAIIGLQTTTGVPISRPGGKAAFHQDLLNQDCLACHRLHRNTRLVPQGEKHFSHALLVAAVREQCERCHQPPADRLHRAVTSGCPQCHNPEHWRPATFDHEKQFALTGHHQTACITCHLDRDYTRYTCYGCHEHQEAQLRAKHLHEGIRNIDNCVRCHRSGDEESSEQDTEPEGNREHD